MFTILCVDDERRILELHRALLEQAGYNVLTATDGRTGIAVARKQLIHAAVLDFDMRSMRGDEVAEILIKEQPQLPIIICTGLVDEIPEWLKWFAAGIAYKGDGPQALLSTVQQCLQRFPARASVRNSTSVTLPSNLGRRAS